MIPFIFAVKKYGLFYRRYSVVTDQACFLFAPKFKAITTEYIPGNNSSLCYYRGTITADM